MDNIKKIRKMAQKLHELENAIFDEIIRIIDESEALPDTTPIGKNMVTVNISTIMKNGHILSPEYYIQDVQKDAIKSKLHRVGKDIDKLSECIENMISTQKIKGSTSDKDVHLNRNSIATLQRIHEMLMV